MQQTAFDDRYGAGAHERLLALLRQPCVSFAEIGDTFGVTRERVRQWHRALLPEAPAGRERRRACIVHRRRRRLFDDPLFRAFYRHAREHFAPQQIQPLRTQGGYRTGLVRIDGRAVAIRDGRAQALPRYRGDAEFIYVRLAGDDFLFMPASVSRRTEQLAFRNTFAALRPAMPGGTASSRPSASASAHAVCAD